MVPRVSFLVRHAGCCGGECSWEPGTKLVCGMPIAVAGSKLSLQVGTILSAAGVRMGWAGGRRTACRLPTESFVLRSLMTQAR